MKTYYNYCETNIFHALFISWILRLHKNNVLQICYFSALRSSASKNAKIKSTRIILETEPPKLRAPKIASFTVLHTCLVLQKLLHMKLINEKAM